MTEVIIHIKDGALINEPAVKKFFDELFKFNKGDGKYLLTAKNIKKRSLSQNNYYWSCMVPLVKEGLRHLGWDDIQNDEEAHEYLKEQFLKRRIINRQTGEVKEIPGSTRALTTIEFSDFIERVIKFGAEDLNVQIPYPNESLVMFYDQGTKATIVQ